MLFEQPYRRETRFCRGRNKPMKAMLIAATVAAVAIAFAAQAQPKPRQACFAVNQLGQTAAPDDSTLNARVGKDVWQIKMAVPCHNLSFNASGYLLNLHSGITNICGPLDLDISVLGIGGGTCFTQSVRKLSPAEVAALPKKAIP
jgi:hypothetical protein